MRVHFAVGSPELGFPSTSTPSSSDNGGGGMDRIRFRNDSLDSSSSFSDGSISIDSSSIPSNLSSSSSFAPLSSTPVDNDDERTGLLQQSADDCTSHNSENDGKITKNPNGKSRLLVASWRFLKRHLLTILLGIIVIIFSVLVLTIFQREHGEPLDEGIGGGGSPGGPTHSPSPPGSSQPGSPSQNGTGHKRPINHDLFSQEIFLTVPKAQSAQRWSRYYSSRPHMAGSPGDYEQALWTAERFREFGLENVRLETYYPLLNYPVQQRVAIVSPPAKRFECSMSEQVLAEDEDSRRYQDSVPNFFGYSADGDVTGPLIYVGYGRPEDFQTLQRRGVNFTGTIALVKYGRNFRGLKVRAAEQSGCAGVLIYSDPADDGYSRGPVYPQGPWRPESSVQRGSVHYNSLYPGDPLTPGWAATRWNITRLPIEQSVVLPRIPAVPLAYRDAKPLLEALQRHGLDCATQLPPKDWLGGLNGQEYWTGPTPGLQVRLVNRVHFNITPVWNVMGELKGSEEPEKVVLLGNHRDAWVLGAADPVSGSASMLEVVRGFGELIKTGWRPKRTIMFASWDAEEYGMVGSTEFVEQYAQSLGSSLIAYLNVDVGACGPLFRIDATPSLSEMIRRLARLVEDPATGLSLYEAWLSGYATNSSAASLSPAAKEQGDERTFPLVNTLGSGSDFVGFVDMLGVASINAGFRGPYGVYHSLYDSFHWMSKYGDPGFHYHVLAAQIWGLMALELAQSTILPFNYTEYAVELRHYTRSIEQMMPTSTVSPLTYLHAAVDRLQRTGASVERMKLQLLDPSFPTNRLPVPEQWRRKKIKSLNQQLVMAERAWLDPVGLPGRLWYKHVVYAPGLWAGYGAATFPALTEAVERAVRESKRNSSSCPLWEEVRKLDARMAAFVDRVTNILTHY